MSARAHTSGLPVVGLCQELSDLVGGYGKGDASCHFQCVDPDHLAVLEQKAVSLMSCYCIVLYRLVNVIIEKAKLHVKCENEKMKKKKGLPDLSEALLSCHTVNQKRCNTYYFLCFVRKRQYMHTDYASSSPYVDDGVSLNVVHVGVAEAQLSAASLSGADDSRSNRVLEGKRAADGDHELPWSEV